MGYLSTLTPSEINAIAAELAGVAGPSCGSCHAVILASLGTGQHSISKHKTQFGTTATSCGTCHGTGYTTSAVVALTHNDGNKTIAVVATGTGIRTWVKPVLNAAGAVTTKGSCTPSCHGKKSW
jgi:hypothetical protein